MKEPVFEAAGLRVEARRSPTRWFVLLGIACLAVVSGISLSVWIIGLPPSWTMDYDRALYARITKAIAADPQHFCGRRLHDVNRELGLEDLPWDDGNLQNLPGSLRIYHFRGFALYLTLDYMRQGVTQSMLLGTGPTSEQLQARDLLRIDSYNRPSVMIDGINDREERMRQYWARAYESVRKHNEHADGRGQHCVAGRLRRVHFAAAEP